jgi:hypothetical protein
MGAGAEIRPVRQRFPSPEIIATCEGTSAAARVRFNCGANKFSTGRALAKKIFGDRRARVAGHLSTFCARLST